MAQQNQSPRSEIVQTLFRGPPRRWNLGHVITVCYILNFESSKVTTDTKHLVKYAVHIRRGHKGPRQYPSMPATITPGRIAVPPNYFPGAASRVVALLRKRVWTWIIVLILCTTASIPISTASSIMSSDDTSSDRLGSDFYVNITNLLLYFAALFIAVSRPKGTPHLVSASFCHHGCRLRGDISILSSHITLDKFCLPAVSTSVYSSSDRRLG